jgi:hypothetical protein
MAATMYTKRNFFTKQELRDAVTAGNPPVELQADFELADGTYTVRGPHGNQPAASWYASVTVRDGVVIEVLR